MIEENEFVNKLVATGLFKCEEISLPFENINLICNLRFMNSNYHLIMTFYKDKKVTKEWTIFSRSLFFTFPFSKIMEEFLSNNDVSSEDKSKFLFNLDLIK